jgi:molecular chaperone DnaK (HSP70)
MRLGIDLGTSRTVVALADRGNYPIVTFFDESGDAHEHWPSITAEVNGKLVHGIPAVAAARAGAPSLSSWKRLLGLPNATSARVTIGEVEIGLPDLITDYVLALRHAIATRSNLKRRKQDELEVVVAVPANAHSTQRFLTLDAFRRAGYSVRAMLNEPSAAGLEYAHRHKDTITSRREHVLIYDLGGGTFDAALVRMSAGQHDVLATSGVGRLGGDDFDAALLDLALDLAHADVDHANVPVVRARLLEECRLAKEAIHPNTKRIAIDLAALGAHAPNEPVFVPVTDYYDRVRPLIERTIDALAPVIACTLADDEEKLRDQSARRGAGMEGESEVAGIYVVGGASGLPAVPRVLRERFSRRVHRSPYPSAATAIGLAIATGEPDAPAVFERFTRHLGVFRERSEGAEVAFDGIFEKGTEMPGDATEPLIVTRRYRAAHNIGHFRFVECGELDLGGDPAGDITPHAEVLFPFARELRGLDDLTGRPVERLGQGPLVEERYEVDPAGILAITITDLDAGYARRYVL